MIFIGIDIASKQHDCCMIGQKGEVLAEFKFANNKQGFEKLLAEIGRFSAPKNARIGLESTGHYSTNIQNYLLQKRLSVRVFNPLQVNMARKAETLRKTKTDKSDAAFLARLLVSDGESKSYSPQVWDVAELRMLTRSRFRLVASRSKYKLSISRLVTLVFPELTQAVWSANQKSCYALLSEFPTAYDIANAHLSRLSSLLWVNSRGKYDREKAVEIRELARNSIGLNSRAAGFELRQAIRLIQNLQSEIDLLDKEIAQIMKKVASPVLSIPGIGNVLGAMIISEIGDVANFATPAKLLAFAGLEPSTYQSGNFCACNTPMVKRGSKYLRWALIQAARLVAYRDETFGRYYAKKKAQGKHHFVVLSHTAKKLIRVIFHLLKTGQDFQPQLG